MLFAGHKLKVLAGTRRKYAEDIGRHIFSICIEENRPETDAPKQGNADFLRLLFKLRFLSLLFVFVCQGFKPGLSHMRPAEHLNEACEHFFVE